MATHALRQHGLTCGLSGCVCTGFAFPGVRSVAPLANREEEEGDTEARQPWEEERASSGPQGRSAAPAFSFTIFSLSGEDLDETGTQLLFAQRFTGQNFFRPHSFHIEIQLQKSVLGKDHERCLQACIPGLVDESFSHPTREKPISSALKARN